MKSWKAEAVLVFITFVWGATFLFSKLGLRDCSPFLFIVLRIALALLASLLLFSKHLHGFSPRIIKGGILLGLLMTGGMIFQIYGLEYTSVSKSAFITGISVVLTPFAYKIIDRKKIAFWQKAGVIVAMLGLWIFTRPDFNNINLGDFLTLCSTFFWAFYISYIDVYTRDNETFKETVQLVVLQFVVILIPNILAFLFFELKDLHVNFSTNLLTALFFNGIMSSFLLTFLQTAVQRYSTPVKAALIYSIEPVIASIIAVIFIHEVMSSLEITGAAILMLGVILSEFGVFLFSIYIFILKLFGKIQ